MHTKLDSTYLASIIYDFNQSHSQYKQPIPKATVVNSGKVRVMVFEYFKSPFRNVLMWIRWWWWWGGGSHLKGWG